MLTPAKNLPFFEAIRNPPEKLPTTENDMFIATPLVVTEHGTGFIDERGDLRLPFGAHRSPAPVQVRPATAEEARAFFEQRMAVRRELSAYYDRKTACGGYTGD